MSIFKKDSGIVSFLIGICIIAIIALLFSLNGCGSNGEPVLDQESSNKIALLERENEALARERDALRKVISEREALISDLSLSIKSTKGSLAKFDQVLKNLRAEYEKINFIDTLGSESIIRYFSERYGIKGQ